jgi:uncharacterized protein
MSHADIEALRAGYEAFNRGDTGAWLDGFDPDAELRELPNLPGTVHRGHDGLREWAESLKETWEEYRFEPEEFTDAGEFVLVSVRARGRGLGSGAPAEMQVFHVFELRDGKVLRVGGYIDRAEALEAVGLRQTP